jgi:acetyl esterase/lipase
MTLSIDPQIATAAEAVYSAMARSAAPRVGDWQTRRHSLDKMFARLVADWPSHPEVSVEAVNATGPSGDRIPARLYRHDGSSPGSLVVYAHGGGMISCSIDTHDPICRRIAAETGVPVLSVGYRLSPEHPAPTAVEDTYQALQWTGGTGDWDPMRLVMMGDSAGGGIAAGVSLMARDRGGITPAAQVLIYPMLDDRTASADPELAPWLMWSPDDNITAWQCHLGDAYGTNEVSPYAAPARASGLAGLPPTYLDVGQLDLYCRESITYASRLEASNVDVELHVFRGAPHAFELFAPNSDIARAAWDLRLRFIRDV